MHFIDGMHFIDEYLIDKWFFIFWEDKDHANDFKELQSIRWGYIRYMDLQDYIYKNELVWGKDAKKVQEEYKKNVLEDIKKYVEERSSFK